MAGRRFGKTCYAISELILKALSHVVTKNWYVAPTYHQAKEIAWKMLFNYLPKEFIVKKNESELKVTLINGSEIALKGADNPESLKGVGLNFCVMDEYGQMKEEAWDESIRPTLLDSKGEAIFIGTPVGYNHFWKIFNKEKDDPDYKSFHFGTVDNLAIPGIVEEVAKAKEEMDPIKFSQEIEANFEALVGRPRFDPVILKRMFGECTTPMRGNLEYINGYLEFFEDKRGIIEVYRFPENNVKGVIGADIAEGKGNDSSSASFVNLDTLSEDIVINTNRMDPHQFAAELWKLGKWTNNSLVSIESNGPGLACILPLRNGQGQYKPYSKLYYKDIFDEEMKKKTKKFGWLTNAKTKPLMIDFLAQLIREGLINIPSQDTIRELQTYIVEDDGKMNAVEGCHDDRVMSLAISCMMHKLRPTVQLPDEIEEGKAVY